MMNPFLSTHDPSHTLSSTDVAELTWENGCLAIHELSNSNSPTKAAAASRSARESNNGTLESVVHQATCTNFLKNNRSQIQGIVSLEKPTKMLSVVGSTSAMSNDDTLQYEKQPGPDQNFENQAVDEVNINYSGSESENWFAGRQANKIAAAEDRAETAIIWPSWDRPQEPRGGGNFSSKPVKERGDSCSLALKKRNNEEKEGTNKEETVSISTKRSRAADVHNTLERRRRDRINMKMKALQKLVPNASKASKLDEVVDYLKHLKSQLHMMNLQAMPPTRGMMTPAAMTMQQHLHLSLMGHMMGMGMPMPLMDMVSVGLPPVAPFLHPTAGLMPSPITPSFIPQPQMVVNSAPPLNQAYSVLSSASSPHGYPYYSLLPQQSMNFHYYNKMVTFYQQLQKSTIAISSSRKNRNP